ALRARRRQLALELLAARPRRDQLTLQLLAARRRRREAALEVVASGRRRRRLGRELLATGQGGGQLTLELLAAPASPRQPALELQPHSVRPLRALLGRVAPGDHGLARRLDLVDPPQRGGQAGLARARRLPGGVEAAVELLALRRRGGLDLREPRVHRRKLGV